MIRAQSQHLSGIIRIGVDYAGYPAPWDYQVTWASIDGKHAALFGLKGDSNFSHSHKTAIGCELWQMGFRSAEWERIERDGDNYKSRPIAIPEYRLRAAYHAQIAKMAEAA